MKNTIWTLLFSMLMITCYGQKEKGIENCDTNITHAVYFWLENPDDEDVRKAFENSL